MKHLLLLLALLPGIARAQAAADSAARLAAAFPVLDRLYAAYAAQNHVPGLAYGVVVGGRLVHTGAVGYADIAAQRPATAQTVFRIASMTKSFVALAVLRLRDEGRLRLDDPVAQYLPQLKQHPPLLAGAAPDAPPITLRQLLSHSAGLPEDNPWGDRQMARPDRDLLALLDRQLPLANAPGTAYEYSNLGFALLGRVVTQVSGQPVQQYITEKLLRPLGMSHTTWEYTAVPPASLALGYRWPESGPTWRPEPLLPNGEAFAALGGLLTSVDDFAKYLAFMASAWPPRPGSDTGPVRRSSVREAQRLWTFAGLSTAGRCSLASGYGYGLRVAQDCHGRRYVGHSGGLPGFGSQWWLLPDYGVAVVALTNRTYAAPTQANFAALDTLLALAGLRPRPVAASPILARRKTELAQLLPAWDTTANNPIFAENFFLDDDLPTRRRTAQALFAQIGPVRHVGELRSLNQLRGTFDVVGERGRVEVFFTLSPENPARVQALELRVVR